MNKKIILALFLCCASTQLFAQLEFRSGLTLSGGISHLWNKNLDANSLRVNSIIDIYGDRDVKFTSYSGPNAALGYKFRLEQKSKRFFYDIDYFLGFKKHIEGYSYTENDFPQYGPFVVHRKDSKHLFFYTSLNPSVNYRINKYLYAGVGLEPTLFFGFHEGGFATDMLDMSFTSKIGVNLKYVELAIGYKVGLFNAAKRPEYFKSFNANDLQLQLYIPF